MDAGRNVVAGFHVGHGGDIDAALAASHTTVTGEWRSSRVTHAALETHGAVGWIDEGGRLVIRSSTQVPFLVRNELAHVFDLERDRVRVYAARVGGGFGGKQELFTEDLTALAVLRLGRPSPTSSRAPTSSSGRLCGIRCASARHWGRMPTAPSPR